MITCKELRQRAWSSLENGYWNAVIAVFLSNLILGLGSIFTGASSTLTQLATAFAAREDSHTLPMILLILSLAVMVLFYIFCIFVVYPLEVGTSRYFILNTDRKPDVSEIFYGFKTNYFGNIKIMFIMNLKVVLWTLLLIVPGIIKSYEYAMIPYILADNPGISSKEAFRRSKALMNGHKFDLFIFQLSYIGWSILGSIVCFGFGMLFVTPYISAGNAEFYKEVSKVTVEEN